MKDSIVINGVTYVRETPELPQSRFRVTVMRVDGPVRSGKHHTLDIMAGSWMAALRDAAAQFDYRQ